jgi:uncharacterized protein YkwD
LLQLHSARLHIRPRAIAIALFAALAAVALPAPAQSHASGSRHDRVERSIIRSINAIRAGSGLHAVRADRRLARSADFHSRDMLRANFFAHASSNGQSFAQRVESFRPSNRIGETLAYVPKGQGSEGQRIVDMWMNSPPHRASLLNPSFRRVGVARRRGTLGNQRVTVFTADFASKH